MALAGYLYERNRTGSVYHPHARFIPQPTPTALPKAPPDRFSWPIYGYTKDHSRFFPAPAGVRPPFRQLWERNSHALLEFPPVIYGERIFQLGDNGNLRAIDKRTGQRSGATGWAVCRHPRPRSRPTPSMRRSLPAVTPAPPGAWSLSTRPTGHPLVSQSPKPQRVLAPARSGRIFFGSQNGTVYALNYRTGH